MNYLLSAMVFVPAVIFLISVVMMFFAKKNSEVDETIIGSIDGKQASSKFLIFLSYPATSVIYGIMSVFLIYQSTGTLTIPENMKMPCIIALVCYSVSCAVKGLIGSMEISTGSLYNDQFSKATVKICLPEIISIAGLMYFFLNYTNNL